MNIIDISRPLTEETAVYKNYPVKRVKIETIADHGANGYRESNLHTNLHTGTHIDAPLHMIAGAEPMSTWSLDHFLGSCLVLDCGHVADRIARADLEGRGIRAGDIVLLRTRNSLVDAFEFDFVALSPDGARCLVEQGVRTVGIDAMSIERDDPTHETHRILLGAGIAIIEDLRLAAVAEGRYQLSCLPLSLPGCEAAPARAVLWDGPRPDAALPVESCSEINTIRCQ
ncbi:MAG: cyclase family protein [Bacillota bacterium]|nr:cyclase family protein [Bacillota bacterium]